MYINEMNIIFVCAVRAEGDILELGSAALFAVQMWRCEKLIRQVPENEAQGVLGRRDSRVAHGCPINNEWIGCGYTGCFGVYGPPLSPVVHPGLMT